MRYAHPGTDGAKVSFKSRYGNYIGGEFVAPVKGQYFDNTSPVNGKLIAEFPRSTAEDIDKALDASPAALLSGDNNLDKRYQLKALPAKENLSWVEAIPKQNDSNFNRVRLGFTNNEVRKMELEDSFGQTTKIELRTSVVNGKPDAGLFRFTPPKGADVIRQ